MRKRRTVSIDVDKETAQKIEWLSKYLKVTEKELVARSINMLEAFMHTKFLEDQQDYENKMAEEWYGGQNDKTIHP